MNLYPQLILDALKKVRYPGTGEDIVSLGMVEALRIEGHKVSFNLRFAKQNDPFHKSVIKAAEQALLTFVSPDIEIKGNITPLFPEAKPVADTTEQPLKGVKNTIAVFSGKGGVGKSTLTANLAVALSLKGYRVGVIDADIYGPSMPKMFGCEEARPVAQEIDGKELIEPIEVFNGIKLLSIGFFVDPDKALIWRGSMASNAVTQIITQANWGELDFLLLDMPPGTGDIHLTIVQTIALSGIIMVTTPQEVALVDVRKGIDLFTNDKIEVPILGIVENMAWFTPQELPNNRYYIFGKGGGERLAQELKLPLLAQIPIVESICSSGDQGLPSASQKDNMLSLFFDNFADAVVKAVQERNSKEPPTKRVEMRH